MSLNINISAKSVFLIFTAIYLGAGITIAGIELTSGGSIFRCIDSNAELRNLTKKESIPRAIMFTVFWLPLTLSESESLLTGSHCMQ